MIARGLQLVSNGQRPGRLSSIYNAQDGLTTKDHPAQMSVALKLRNVVARQRSHQSIKGPPSHWLSAIWRAVHSKKLASPKCPVLRLRKPGLGCLGSKQQKPAPANLSRKWNLLQGEGDLLQGED